MHLTPSQIAHATGLSASAINNTWPRVVAALAEQGIDDRATEIASAATIAIECPPWMPIREWGNLADLEATYGAYYGRGLLQLTWLGNYRAAGQWLSLDLVDNPDLALDLTVSPRIFAWYFKTRNVHVYANNGDWIDTRRAVNGWVATPNGWDQYKGYINALLALPDSAPLPAPAPLPLPPTPPPAPHPVPPPTPQPPVHHVGSGHVVSACSLKQPAGHTTPAIAQIPAGSRVQVDGPEQTINKETWSRIAWGHKGHLYQGFVLANNVRQP